MGQRPQSSHRRTTQPFVDFNPIEFESLIEQHGAVVLYERAAVCGCRNADGVDQPAVGCPTCGGSGFAYWGASIERAIIQALDLDQNTQMAWGSWSSGTAKLTFMSSVLPSFRDRLTVLDSLFQFSETVPATTAAPLPLRYWIGSRRDVMDVGVVPEIPRGESVGARAEALVAAMATATATSVERDVLYARGYTGATRSQLLVRGQDFEVADGRMRLVGAGAWERVSVVYVTHPRYTVTSFNHGARDRWLANGTLARLPVAMMGKLDFLPSESPGYV
ncbi:MAG: hypothetical protein EKK55_18325 [Rhodocyclaceae bacterium]|nr:MAG: hypothetical protein EKK55_18325 [Rhodocyclaceae bacterium]